MVINEIHYDPSSAGLDGDANGNGTVETKNDEFIEIVNTSTGSVDVTGWVIRFNQSDFFTFPSLVVPGESAIVVFGGGSPTGTFGGSIVYAAGAGWTGLLNPGGVISLVDGTITNSSTDYAPFADDLNQSITRNPDGTGTLFIAHAGVSPCGKLFSPGVRLSDQPFPGSGLTNTPPCISPVPASFTQAGQIRTIQFSTFDLDGNLVSLAASNLPASASFTDHLNGTATLVYTGQLSDAGSTFLITVYANDGQAVSYVTFSLYIVEALYTGIIINEYLADPDASGNIHIDANADGVENVNQDEFIEIINNTTGSLNFAGFQIRDASTLRHIFKERLIPSGGSLVVFGGGSLINFSNPPAQTATSGGLDLQQLTQESIILLSPQTTVVDRVDYASAEQAVSATRFPDITGNFTSHLAVATNLARASPGRRVDDSHFLSNQPPVMVDIGNQFIAVSNLLQFHVRAYDPADADVMTLTASNLPLNALFAATNGAGTFSWIPSATQGGLSFTVTFTSADLDGTETAVVDITVIQVSAAEDVWINEIHYDNISVDANEGIEVAGSAGTDLGAYTLIEYNGANGLINSSNTLSGAIDDENCGFGATWFAISGLQNDHEAIALIKDGTNVIQFLSWEGVVTAQVGAAIGQVSVNIGVSENASTPLDHSLQLTGTGTAYSAFAWQPEQPHSRGTLNIGQEISACGAEVGLRKTVYLGHDDGASCPGFDYITGQIDEPVTYCFTVTNSGLVSLAHVTVTDLSLPGFIPVNLGTLAPGQSGTIYFEAQISGDLTNTAEVTGTPPFGPEVSAGDTAEVNAVSLALILQKTVYPGHDGGTSGPGVELVQATNGAAVTYYFTMMNGGDVTLTNAVIIDNDLTPPWMSSPGEIQPGETFTQYMETVVSGDLTNTAIASAWAADLFYIQDTDSAEVKMISPSLYVEKTVYIGHDAVSSCPGVQFVQGTNGTPVTYCITVRNTGNTTLDNVTVNDLPLAMAPIMLGTMTTGQVDTLYIESFITQSLVNQAVVTGEDPNGDQVAASDTAEVEMIIPTGDCQFAYDVIEIPTLGGTNSFAYSINDLGQVVGSAQTSNGLNVAFLWQSGSITNLGTLPGGQYSRAGDINNKGWITGTSDATGLVDGVQIDDHAFLITNGVLKDLGTLGGKTSDGKGLNEAGDVAGWSFERFQTAVNQPFLHTKGTNINLETFNGTGDSGQAFDVNNHTQVVGFAFGIDPPKGLSGFSPFVWQDLNGNNRDDNAEMVVLGTFGGWNGVALSINDLQQITGGADTTNSGVRHAFLINPIIGPTNTIWYIDADSNRINDIIINVGALPGHIWSEGNCINDSGIIVGRSGALNNQPFHAFIFEDGSIKDLNALIHTNTGWHLDEAKAINNSGQIVGFGTLNGERRGFLLNPCEGSLGGNLMITRLIVADHNPRDVTIVWRGAGVNLSYVIESSPLIEPATWTAQSPTNQWPILSTFWPTTLGTNLDQEFFRVRAVTNQ